jgi:hypothetical protein
VFQHVPQDDDVVALTGIGLVVEKVAHGHVDALVGFNGISHGPAEFHAADPPAFLAGEVQESAIAAADVEHGAGPAYV